MEAWVAGLLGTLVGTFGSVAGVWIQNHFQARRERVRMVMEFAVQDRKNLIDEAKASGKGGPVAPVAPVALFAHYHGELFRLIERGNFSVRELDKISEDNSKLWASIKKNHAKQQAGEL